jgi:hypothetical protein
MSELLTRLSAFRREHPGVLIRRAPHGRWDAEVPLPRDGEGYFSPRPLDLLLDALEEELDCAPP